MKLGFLGTDHKRSSLIDIERIYLKRDRWQQFCLSVGSDSPISELVVLATCNRFEIYFATANLNNAVEWLIFELSKHSETPEETIREITYSLADEDMIKHLFKVAAGIESMVFGEDEILAQVKNAYAEFSQFKTTGPVTNKLFQTATAVGKRVRHETEISRGAYSVSSIAIDAIKEQIWDYFEKSILVIGTGTIGNRAIKKLVSMGHPNLTICNRTLEKASAVAAGANVSILPFDQFKTHLYDFDIIVVATAASSHIITPDLFLPNSGTQLIIDLTVPRNVDPETETPTRKIIAVDGLKKIADKNVMKRQKESAKIHAILHEELEKFENWCDQRSQRQK